MAERELTRPELEKFISDIRERVAKFIKDSVDRVHDTGDKDHLEQQGELIKNLLDSYAKKFDA